MSRAAPWPRVLGLAARAALSSPRLRLLAAAGLLARGGILLFVLPILPLPTPVAVATFFGPDAVTAAGPSPRFVLILAAMLALVVLAGTGAALVAAWTDAESFRELVGQTGLGGSPPGALSATPPGRDELLPLAGLQVSTVLPALFALAVSARGIVEAARTEFLLPSSSEVPYVVRVAAAARDPLLRVALLLVVGELLATLATRYYLADPLLRGSRKGHSVRDALRHLVANPASTFATWFVGWLVLLATLAAAVAAISLGWDRVTMILLDPALGPAAPDRVVQAIVACLAFVAFWLAALGLAAAASALRAALWTLEVLRRGGAA